LEVTENAQKTPLQPPKVEPLAGTALSVTVPPLAKAAERRFPQLIQPEHW
jgi:hypothetical protein